MLFEGVLNEGCVATEVDKLANGVRSGPMWPMAFGLACSSMEMMHAGARQL